MSQTHRATTLRELLAEGYERRTVKEEIRDNLLARLRSGETAFPGIVGFDDTVLPELESALLAGHDLVMLGERGQGKTRLMRTIGGLLDEWSPAVQGCEINDDPLDPVCGRCRRLRDEVGADLPLRWRHRPTRSRPRSASTAPHATAWLSSWPTSQSPTSNVRASTSISTHQMTWSNCRARRSATRRRDGRADRGSEVQTSVSAWIPVYCCFYSGSSHSNTRFALPF